MGVYNYARKNDVKMVDGIEIVRFAYTCKESFSVFEKAESFLHNKYGAAENNAEKTANVNFGIMGDWKYASEKDGIPVFRIYKHWTIISDACKKEVVGILRKMGRKYKFEPSKEFVMETLLS